MTLAFNKKKEQEKRHYLRKNMPTAEVILWSKLKNKKILGERFLRFTNPDVCDNLDGVCLMIFEEIETIKKRDNETKKKK